MTAHTHRELVEGCYRCDLNRDEVEAAMAEDAWLVTIASDFEVVVLDEGVLLRCVPCGMQEWQTALNLYDVLDDAGKHARACIGEER